MNTSKLLATAVTAVAFVSVIGLAYAQTSTEGNSPGTSTSSEPDSKYIAPKMDASTMPQPVAASPDTSNSPSTSPSASPNTSTTDSAPVDNGAPMAQMPARTDRN